MRESAEIVVVSDIHYAGAMERTHKDYESKIITNKLARDLVGLYRRHVWLRDPTGEWPRLGAFLKRAGEPDWVIGNGDFSCDTGFVGVSEPAALESVGECLRELRTHFPGRFIGVMGDHELGKKSLVGGVGGMRVNSFHLSRDTLGLEPLWMREIGGFVLLGVTSSLLALPVFEGEMLESERAEWEQIRSGHLAAINSAVSAIGPRQRLILFCHDPTALPYLLRETALGKRLDMLERTVIGHLHTRVILWKTRVLAGIPAMGPVGSAARRMTRALNEARLWRPFKILFCPALVGTQLFDDGGFLRLRLTGGDKPTLSHEVVWMPRATILKQ